MQYEAPDVLRGLVYLVVIYLQNDKFDEWSRGGSNP